MYNQPAILHYSEECFHGESIDRIIAEAKLKLAHLDYDTFVCRGMSGCLLTPFLAKEFNKRLCVVRKESNCHDFKTVIGHKPLKNYIIVDDFISSGSTIQSILDNMNVEHKCVCIFLYSADYDVQHYIDRLSGIGIISIPIITISRFQ
jgi:orotate phosphoribosyltransferase